MCVWRQTSSFLFGNSLKASQRREPRIAFEVSEAVNISFPAEQTASAPTNTEPAPDKSALHANVLARSLPGSGPATL